MESSSSWTDAELAYFAGIIDGEGCFCLHNPGSHRLSCQLQIGNTDLRLLDWIHSRFGGTVRPERRANAKHKPMWRWFAKADDLDRVIRAVLPYLVIKRDRAELILAYRATLSPRINSRRSTHDTPDHVKHERMRIHTELAALNRRGAA